MSLGLWPEAVPFDPNSGTASDDLRRHFDAGRMAAAVLVVCSRDLRGAEWPAKAAIGLARALAGGPRPVVLLDVDFERPTLHGMLDIANTEGVADALLFGASLERVTVEPPGEMFGFVPPGAVAPDPAALMADAAWLRLLGEAGSASSLLLVYSPLGAAGLDALAERLTSVVLLAEETEVAATAAMLPDTIRVDGVVRPAVAAAPAPVEDVTTAPEPLAEPSPSAAVGTGPEDAVSPPGPVVPAKEEARQALKADIESRQRAAESGAPPGKTPAPAEPAPPRPPGPTHEPVWRRVLPWAVLIVVLTMIGWLAGRLIAGPGDDAGRAAVGPDGSPLAEEAGSLLGYSVAIEAYDELPAAVSRADSLSLAAPDLLFFVAPIELDESIYYSVLAGPMADSAAASVAMHRLVQQGLKIAASEFDVRSTPLAFLVGQYEFRGDAEARMIELEGLDVPTYIMEVPYRTGPSRFHVYAGAYYGPTEAAVMRRRLREAGVRDTLVLRVGRSRP